MARHFSRLRKLAGPAIFGVELFARRRKTSHEFRFQSADEGAGGGGAAWPDYNIPDGALGGGDDDHQQQQPAQPQAGAAARSDQQGAQAAGREPAARTVPPNAPAQGGQQQPQPGQQQQPAQLPSLRDDPEYRRLVGAHEALLRQVETQRAALGAALGITQQAQERPLTQQEQQLRNRLLQIFPELNKLVTLTGHVDALTNVATNYPGIQNSQQLMWDRHSADMTARVHDAIAGDLLNDATKKGADLTPEQQNWLTRNFFIWLSGDQQLQRRYEVGDPRLAGEFKAVFSNVFNPGRRVQAANTQQRAASAARQPQGGQASPVASPVQNQQQSTDPKTVHDRGWAALQNALQQA